MHFLYVFVFFSHHIFIILITAQNNTHLSLSLSFFFFLNLLLSKTERSITAVSGWETPNTLRAIIHQHNYFMSFCPLGRWPAESRLPQLDTFSHTPWRQTRSHSLLLRAQFHFILQRSTHHVLPNKNLAVMSFSFKADLVQSPLQDNNQPHSRRPRLARTHTQHRPLIPLTAASSFLLTIGGETIHSTPLTAENLFYLYRALSSFRWRNLPYPPSIRWRNLFKPPSVEKPT